MSGGMLGAAFAVLVLASGMAAAQPAKPNDAQIAHIAYTAGEIDIKAAQQALQKSRNREVREFAQQMVRDHRAVNKQALALVKKLNVTPPGQSDEPNPAEAGRCRAPETREAEGPGLRPRLCGKRGGLPSGGQQGA